VLYDIASDYPKGLAENFRDAAEELGIEVVAFESFSTGDTDFSAQLTNIIAAEPDVLFTPQYYSEVPQIVQQARELGFEGNIAGSDSWGTPDLITLCGEACEGLSSARTMRRTSPPKSARRSLWLTKNCTEPSRMTWLH
jgi:branched-chain amino acid transport system substrate-binding protein